MSDKDPPKWMTKLFDIIYNVWHYHGNCTHINFQHSKDNDNKIWMLKAAPVYQQIYGGEDDGKKGWIGFSFDIGEFGKVPGVKVLNQMIASYCDDCTPYPKHVLQGEFNGHLFMLLIMLEPDPNSPIVEIVDHIKKEIREATDEEIAQSKENELVSMDDEEKPFKKECKKGKWIPKPKYREFVSKDEFTDEELVDLFIDKTMYWYTDKQNGLFGWQKCVKEYLIKVLKHTEIDYEKLPIPENAKKVKKLAEEAGVSVNMPMELVLVEKKFTNEWIGPEGMFSEKKVNNGTAETPVDEA